jgi:tetratricopeptide (TPR) repeat protein
LSQTGYRAFISYSHRDETWGRWLQRALESYRIPRRLVGKEGEYGKIPARLSPVFRDREDLSSAADLSQSVRQELDQSETLVVICSPASAQSHWVNEEIHYFRSLGRADRIYALIVDGDPQSTKLTKSCFPPALLASEDGNQVEPLAADLRKWADGKLLARLKLISGILGIRLDDLRRRDMQRRHRLWMASSTAALAVAVVTTILAVMAVNARHAAENRREHAENLVGYMVGDLREKLASVGRLDILDSMGEQVTQYLETLDPGEVTDESLNQQAQVWRQLGEVSKDQGKLTKAMEAFTSSRDVLTELFRRQPDDINRLFELGQAEFWVGYVHLDLGDLPATEEAFSAYLEIARQLFELQPDNADWIMEMSYALANMGWLEQAREGSNPEKVLGYMESSLEYNRNAVTADPGNRDFRIALTNAYADIADAHIRECNLGSALEYRTQNLELAAEFHEAQPGNSKLKVRLAYALSGLGHVQRRLGMTEQALAYLRESERLLDELSKQDVSNLNYRWEKFRRTKWITKIQAHLVEQETTLASMAVDLSLLNEIDRSEGVMGITYEAEYIDLLEVYSEFAFETGDTLLAELLLQDGLQRVVKLVEENPDHGPSHYYLYVMAFQFWQQHQRKPDAEVMRLLEGHLSQPENIRSCDDAYAAAKLSLLREDQRFARKYTTYLLEKGYFEPGFVHFCRKYGLCNP